MRLSLITQAGLTAATSVTVSSCTPKNAVSVNPAFPGTSFEFNTFPSYCQTSATDGSANQYSINLINEIFKRTGARPILRVGGTTGDYTLWNASLNVPISPAPNQQIGPKFWPLAKLLNPTNPLWMPSISYTDTDYTHANEAAKSIMSAMGLQHLAAIEIGNEPNEYGGHSGPSATDAQYWATRFQAIAANISKAANIPHKRIFAGPDLASDDYHDTDWKTTEVFQKTNLDDKNNIKYATDHWYRCLGQACELHDLLNHKNMISDTQQHIEPTAQFFSTYKNGAVKYYLDEINVLSGTGNKTFSATFATALFAVDWMMYLMSLGTVDSVNWEQVYDSNQNLWQPSTSSVLAAVTKNTYYALIATAEFIGRGGSTKVVEITPDGNDGTYFSAYAAYQGRKLARVALCNLNYWDAADGTKRPVESIELQGLSLKTKTVTVKYLTNPDGAGHDATDTTYGGSQWGYDNLGKEKKGVQQTTVTVRVQGGKAKIPSPDSSIAIVYM